MPAKPRETWIEGAFRFRCKKGCTRCCEGKGFVYLTEDDRDRAATFLGLTRKAFDRKYVEHANHGTILRIDQRAAGKARSCIFLSDAGCSIHAAKPLQCRKFPFWPEFIETRAAWETAADWCPGIGSGPLIQIGTAMERAQEMKSGFPHWYTW